MYHAAQARASPEKAQVVRLSWARRFPVVSTFVKTGERIVRGLRVSVNRIVVHRCASLRKMVKKISLGEKKLLRNE
jgi:hypothetical protein